MNILQKIVENTRDNLKVQKTNLSLEEIKSSLAELSLPKSNFKSSISNKNEAIIAEIKKASPSAGVIAEDFNPASFVNCHDYDNFDSVIKEVIRIDKNEDVYRSYLEQPWFPENKLTRYVDLDHLQNRFRYIFSQIGKKVPAARSKRRFFYKLLKKLKPLTPIVQQWGDYQPSN